MLFFLILVLIMSMVDNAIGLMIAAIVIAGVTVPLIQDTLVLETNSVTNESFTGNSSAYVNLVNSDLVEDSETVYNATDYSVVSDTEYTVNYTEGSVNVSSTYDTASLEIDYEWEPESYVKNQTARLVLGFVVVGLAVSLFMASFSMAR